MIIEFCLGKFNFSLFLGVVCKVNGLPHSKWGYKFTEI